MTKVFAVFALALVITNASAQHTGTKPPIYDEKADGGKQIEKALTDARKSHKNVLLQFGANWCGWCHLLHDTFTKVPEVKEIVHEEYTLGYGQKQTSNSRFHYETCGRRLCENCFRHT